MYRTPYKTSIQFVYQSLRTSVAVSNFKNIYSFSWSINILKDGIPVMLRIRIGMQLTTRLSR